MLVQVPATGEGIATAGLEALVVNDGDVSKSTAGSDVRVPAATGN